MEKITINNKTYEIIKDENKVINIEELTECITEYFEPFDYIVGDYAYSKLRLKGFYDSNNKNVKKYNDIAGLEQYIKEKCAYGCKWFEIKKINDWKPFFYLL